MSNWFEDSKSLLDRIDQIKKVWKVILSIVVVIIILIFILIYNLIPEVDFETLSVHAIIWLLMLIFIFLPASVVFIFLIFAPKELFGLQFKDWLKKEASVDLIIIAIVSFIELLVFVHNWSKSVLYFLVFQIIFQFLSIFASLYRLKERIFRLILSWLLFIISLSLMVIIVSLITAQSHIQSHSSGKNLLLFMIIFVIFTVSLAIAIQYIEKGQKKDLGIIGIINLLQVSAFIVLFLLWGGADALALLLRSTGLGDIYVVVVSEKKVFSYKAIYLGGDIILDAAEPCCDGRESYPQKTILILPKAKIEEIWKFPNKNICCEVWKTYFQSSSNFPQVPVLRIATKHRSSLSEPNLGISDKSSKKD